MMVSLKVLFTTILVNAVYVIVKAQVPTIDPSYSINYVIKPGPLNMTCTMQLANQLDWYIGTTKASDIGRSLMSSTKIDYPDNVRTMSVTIGKTQTETTDSGEYICKADNGTPRTIQVEVLTVNATNADYNKSMGAAVLGCGINIDASKYTMHWEHKGVKLMDGDKYTIHNNNNTLVIQDAKHADGGEYYCVFNFTENKQVLRSLVNFNTSPYVKKFEKSKNLIQGDPLTLKCEVYSHPRPTITWYKDDKSVEGMDRITLETDKETEHENAYLKIAVVEFEDKGDYRCEAHSTYFNATESRQLLVRVKDKLAALWPFLGIVAEVIVLCVIIFIYEKRRSRKEEAEDAADANCANATDHKGNEEVRQRNVRA